MFLFYFLKFWDELSHQSSSHESSSTGLLATFHATGSRRVNLRSNLLEMLRTCPIEEDAEGMRGEELSEQSFLRQKQKTCLIFHDNRLQNTYRVQSVCDVLIFKECQKQRLRYAWLDIFYGRITLN